MATIRQRGSGYQVRWRRGGRGGEELGLTFTDPLKAEMAKDQLKYKDDNLSREDVLCALYPDRAEEIKSAVVTGRTTVREFAEQHFDGRHKTGYRTKARYREQLVRDVFPFIGDKAVADVTVSDIDKILKRLATCDCLAVEVPGPICSRVRGNARKSDRHSRGLSQRTVDRYYNNLRGFFSSAVKANLRSDNPVTALEYTPQTLANYDLGRREEAHFYMTPDQVYKILLPHLKEADQRLVDFIVNTGTRIGEATAVQINAVTKTRAGHHELDVCHAWNENKFGQMVLGKPKNGRPRIIDLDDQTANNLSPNIKGRLASAFLFVGEDGKPINYFQFKHRWDVATLQATRCPDHPPVNGAREVAPQDLIGPRCGDNGGVTERGRECRQFVVPGFDRCYRHCGPAADAQSSCECWDKRLPRRPQIHDLRHTHVAWCNDAGSTIQEIAERIGDTVEVVAKVYLGILRVSRQRLMDHLSARPATEQTS